MNNFFTRFLLLLLFIPLTYVRGQSADSLHSILVDVNSTHQTLTGFGASIAWYGDMLTIHPFKDEIYNLIFGDLGIDILRLQNTFAGDTTGKFASDAEEIVNEMHRISPESKILMSSWSPPAYLKSNGITTNGGTLVSINGKYNYGGFAKYWADALNTYGKIGIVPDFISIQNEPGYTATWESCLLSQAETRLIAGYPNALDSVYSAIQNISNKPKLIGPEVLGIGYNAFLKYAQRINPDHLDAYAYHLYHGESDNVNDNHDPDLFIPNLSSIAKNYSSKPIFETEYDRGDWFNTAWLMNNCLVEGNVSAYLYWELVWVAASNSSQDKALLIMENPSQRSFWKYAHGYYLTKYYWAFRQFSKYIGDGWKRVTVAADDDSLRVSGFINPSADKLTLVVINISERSDTSEFGFGNFDVTSGTVIRTSSNENGTVIDTSFNKDNTLIYPGRSITTVSLTGNIITGSKKQKQWLSDFYLSQNYPNPFNPSTKIRYRIPEAADVNLSVYDLLGNKVASLVDRRKSPGVYYAQWNASGFPSGIYFVKLVAGNFAAVKKLMLIK